jgi:hypothetical protein
VGQGRSLAPRESKSPKHAYLRLFFPLASCGLCRKFHIPPDLVVERVITQRKPPEVRIWSLGAGRGALTSPFPHPRLETVHAAFTAHGSPEIGDFRSQRYHKPDAGFSRSKGMADGLVRFLAFAAASTVLRDDGLPRPSSGTKQLLDQNHVTPLASFPMYAAFPRPEYYDAPDAHALHQGTAPLPA